jgi:hypothetical protein
LAQKKLISTLDKNFHKIEHKIERRLNILALKFDKKVKKQIARSKSHKSEKGKHIKSTQNLADIS